LGQVFCFLSPWDTKNKTEFQPEKLKVEKVNEIEIVKQGKKKLRTIERKKNKRWHS
jgi:hypothetical protein